MVKALNGKKNAPHAVIDGRKAGGAGSIVERSGVVEF